MMTLESPSLLQLSFARVETKNGPLGTSLSSVRLRTIDGHVGTSPSPTRLETKNGLMGTSSSPAWLGTENGHVGTSPCSGATARKNCSPSNQMCMSNNTQDAVSHRPICRQQPTEDKRIPHSRSPPYYVMSPTAIPNISPPIQQREAVEDGYKGNRKTKVDGLKHGEFNNGVFYGVKTPTWRGQHWNKIQRAAENIDDTHQHAGKRKKKRNGLNKNEVNKHLVISVNGPIRTRHRSNTVQYSAQNIYDAQSGGATHKRRKRKDGGFKNRQFNNFAFNSLNTPVRTIHQMDKIQFSSPQIDDAHLQIHVHGERMAPTSDSQNRNDGCLKLDLNNKGEKKISEMVVDLMGDVFSSDWQLNTTPEQLGHEFFDFGESSTDNLLDVTDDSWAELAGNTLSDCFLENCPDQPTDGLDPDLAKAMRQSIETSKLTPLIKEELKYVIKCRRFSSNKSDDDLSSPLSSPTTNYEASLPSSAPQPTNEDLSRKERRRILNRKSAIKCREQLNIKKHLLEKQAEDIVSQNEKLYQYIKDMRKECEKLQSVLQNHKCHLEKTDSDVVCLGEFTTTGTSASSGLRTNKPQTIV